MTKRYGDFPQSKCLLFALSSRFAASFCQDWEMSFFFNRQMWFITQSVEWARQNYSPTFPLRGLARPKSLFWLEAFSLVSVLLNPILFVFRMAKLSVSRENVFCCRPKWKKHDRDVSKTLMPAVTTSNYVRLRIFFVSALYLWCESLMVLRSTRLTCERAVWDRIRLSDGVNANGCLSP